MDTAPPFLPPTEDNEPIYCRGARDAKAIIAAQIKAAEELIPKGVEDIGLLYTGEEERASTGAKPANQHPLAAKCEYLIHGEPTDHDLALGSKGTLRLNITPTGTAAHSAYPADGDSPIDKLLDPSDDPPPTKISAHPLFGEPTVNIPTIEVRDGIESSPSKLLRPGLCDPDLSPIKKYFSCQPPFFICGRRAPNFLNPTIPCCLQ